MFSIARHVAGWRAGFIADETGQDLVEYSLLLGFIALAAVSILGAVAGNIQSIFSTIGSSLTSASTAAQ